MANFQVLDAYGSVITIQSSTFGSAERQAVQAYVGGGTVSIVGTVTVTPSGNQSVSGTVNVNPASVQVLNPVSLLAVNPNPASVQVLNPVSLLAVNPNPSSVWVINPNQSVSGQLGASVMGTVPVTQSGLWQPSALSYVTRNDTIASFLGGDLSTRPQASDSAGRSLVKPFAPEEARVEGYISLTSTSVTTLIAAAGAGLRHYITDLWFANTGSVTTLVTLKDGAGSVLGFTVAPATGGSNLVGLQTPIRTGVNTTFDVQAASPTSTLYATVKGFKAP